MYFLLSKLLVIFIHPLTWAIVLILAAILVKDLARRKKLIIAALIILILFSNPFIFNRVASAWDAKEVSLSSIPKSSAIILLGGYANGDKNGQGYFNIGVERFLAALKLKMNKKADRILITGGNPSLVASPFREADWVREEFRLFQINDSDISVDDASRNSIENAMSSKRILDSLHLQGPYILVTSAFHMKRSLLIFKKTGLNVIPFPCNYLGGRGKTSFSEILPEANILDGWNYYLKEMIGFVVFSVKK